MSDANWRPWTPEEQKRMNEQYGLEIMEWRRVPGTDHHWIPPGSGRCRMRFEDAVRVNEFLQRPERLANASGEDAALVREIVASRKRLKAAGWSQCCVSEGLWNPPGGKLDPAIAEKLGLHPRGLCTGTEATAYEDAKDRDVQG